MAFITNNRNDEALKVKIKSYKAAGVNLLIEGGFNKVKTVETNTVVLQPGERLQKRFDNSNGFEIYTTPVKVIKEQQGIINNIKQRIRLYTTDTKGTIAPVNNPGFRD